VESHISRKTSETRVPQDQWSGQIQSHPCFYLFSISRAIIKRWISLVPSPMVQSLTSR
jgi:hypothetical protein